MREKCAATVSEAECVNTDHNKCRSKGCGSSDISGGSIEVNGKTCHQDVYCMSCGASWVDVYKFQTFTDFKSER